MKHSKISVVLAAFAASLAAASLGQAENPNTAAGPETVDFELMKSMHMAVQVKVNDAGPFRLIFDLGSPLTLISGRAAADGGLISPEKAKKKAFFGMRGEGKVKKFEVGELVVEDLPVMIMDHPTIEAAAEFLGPIDGIVGYPFFARYKFSIDYVTKKMTFMPSDYQPKNVMSQMLGRMFSNKEKIHAAPGGLFGIDVDKPEDDAQPGVTITAVYADSPAAAAGLKNGDRMLTLDGRWCDSVADTFDAATFVKPGEPIRVVAQRGGQRMEVELRLSLGL